MPKQVGVANFIKNKISKAATAEQENTKWTNGQTGIRIV